MHKELRLSIDYSCKIVFKIGPCDQLHKYYTLVINICKIANKPAQCLEALLNYSYESIWNIPSS